MPALWCAVNVCNKIPLEKTNFLFSSSYRLRISSGLEIRLCAHLPSFILGFCLAWACCTVLCMLTWSPWIHMFISTARPGEYRSLDVIHHPWLLQSYHLLFHINSWALRRGTWWRHYVHGWMVQSLYFLHVIKLSVSLLISLHRRTNLMATEWWCTDLTDLCVQWYVIRRHFIVMFSYKNHCGRSQDISSSGYCPQKQ